MKVLRALGIQCAIIALFGLWVGTTFAADEVTDRAVPIQELQIQPAPAAPGALRGSAGTGFAPDSLDQRVAMLQQQVQALTAQVAALQSVLKVSPAGVTIQAPTVTILSSEGIAMQSQKTMSIKAGQNLSVDTGNTLTMKTGAATNIQSAGSLDLKGSILRLNGGIKPIATVGSLVQVPGQPTGQVVTGNSTVLGN